MKILYGFKNYIDVTHIFLINDYVSIPAEDVVRLNMVASDPDFGVVKHILILLDDYYITVSANCSLYSHVKDLSPSSEPISQSQINTMLQNIHNTLIFKYGSITDEMPEQCMAVRFIKPTDTVLEIGANIGRNTCVISRLLNDDSRLITLETDTNNAATLESVRTDNNMNFHIVKAGLSQAKLIQQGWNSKPWTDDSIPDGWSQVNTITWSDLKKMAAPLSFNVLVADCEGALYYICQEEQDFFSNFERIIMENDYTNAQHKIYIDNELKRQGFVCIYREAGGWGPCHYCFFETWAKTELF